MDSMEARRQYDRNLLEQIMERIEQHTQNEDPIILSSEEFAVLQRVYAQKRYYQMDNRNNVVQRLEAMMPGKEFLVQNGISVRNSKWYTHYMKLRQCISETSMLPSSRNEEYFWTARQIKSANNGTLAEWKIRALKELGFSFNAEGHFVLEAGREISNEEKKCLVQQEQDDAWARMIKKIQKVVAQQGRMPICKEPEQTICRWTVKQCHKVLSKDRALQFYLVGRVPRLIFESGVGECPRFFIRGRIGFVYTF